MTADLHARIAELEGEHSAVWNELYCCDDIPLDCSAEEAIGALQDDRVALRADLAKAREETAIARSLHKDAWDGWSKDVAEFGGQITTLTAERDALRERVDALKDGLIDMQALISLYNTEPFKHAAKNGDFTGLRNMVAALIGGNPLVWPAPWVQTQWIETLEKHLAIARQALAQDGEKG